MQSENEDQCLPAQPAEISHQPQKQSRISYSRYFLLSLSELDICKKLPTGFDSSILSEFEDAFHSSSISEQQRVPGSLPLQSFRRSEYSSSPPTRGDSSNFSRGNHGRWDTHSSGLNDRDNDSQSDWDSDSGRRYGNQSCPSWQNAEHDGLLGSDSFPRPSGYIAGASVPKGKGNDHYQLSKSNEPYHPPRPYKALPHSRRGTSDSYNDETFGSVECSSLDRAEEERKRRASFELMRKEQQKEIQENQKRFPDKLKDYFDPIIAALMEDCKDDKMVSDRNNEVDEHLMAPGSHSNSARYSFPAQTSAARPLVPPGFTSTILEKNLGTKSLIHFPVSEVENGAEDNLRHAKANPMENRSYNNQEEKQSGRYIDSIEKLHETKDIHVPFINESKKNMILLSAVEVPDSLVVHASCKTSYLLEASEARGDGKLMDFDPEKVTGHKIVGKSGSDNSTSILEKLFGSALTVNSSGSSSSIEHHDDKTDGTWSPKPFQSSKFLIGVLKKKRNQ